MEKQKNWKSENLKIVVGITPRDLKASNVGKVIKDGWYWRHTHIDQWHRTEKPDIAPDNYFQLSFNEGTNAGQ